MPSLTDFTIEVYPASFPDVSFISLLLHHALIYHLSVFSVTGLTNHCGRCVQCHYVLSSSSDAPLRSTQPGGDHFRRVTSIADRIGHQYSEWPSVQFTPIYAYYSPQDTPPLSRIKASGQCRSYISVLSRRSNPCPSPLPGAFIDIGAIKSLLRFTKLQELYFTTGNLIYFSDEQLAIIMCAS